MKLKATLFAVLLALSAVAQAADVSSTAEPPATPAGGSPFAGIGVAGAVGLAIGVAVIAAVATGGDDDNPAVTGSGSGT